LEQVVYFAKKLYAFVGIKFIINLFAMALISLLEGIGILLLIPLLVISGVANVNLEMTPIAGIVELLQRIPGTLGLTHVLGIYIFLVIGQNLTQRYLTIRNVTVQQSFFRHLRLETYTTLLKANWDFFIKKRKSDIINSLTSELARVNSGTHLFFQILTSLIFALIQISLSFWLSPLMTSLVLLCGFIIAFFSRTFIRRSRKLGYKTSELSQIYLAGITDNFNGIKDIKTNMLEESRITWFHSVTQGILREQIEYIKLKSSSQFFYKVSSAIFISVFIYLSVNIFHSQLQELLLITIIFSRLWPRIIAIQSNMEQLASIIPAFKAIMELQKQCEQAKELKIINDLEHVKPIQMEQGIECENVSFRYNQKEPLFVLQDINLHIPANRTTAIAGRSGAGKSTLIDILMGLIQPEFGQVRIDGKLLTREILLPLRRSISYVSQDPFLFNGSIRENLLMIEPKASEDQMWEALEFSSSAQFVSRFPQGLDTLIGDRGVRLSGGERQRLVLARAILRKPSILVLDEATSALDSENEEKIQEALERLKGTMTIIVIAHRLSTIRNADQVIVLDQGRIVQTGGFNQLAKEKRGVFSKLLGNQMKASL
jgi:ABC-type multidrug transport system fused ATPase/permease subunit